MRRLIASLLVSAECFSLATVGMPVGYALDYEKLPEAIEAVQYEEPASVTPLEAAEMGADTASQYADEAVQYAYEAEQAANEAETAETLPDAAWAAEAAQRADEAAARAATAAERAVDEADWAMEAANQAKDEAVEPEPTAEPETVAEPESAVEPEVTAEPEPTAEPETTIEPESAVEPKPTEEPVVTDESDGAVMVAAPEDVSVTILNKTSDYVNFDPSQFTPRQFALNARDTMAFDAAPMGALPQRVNTRYAETSFRVLAAYDITLARGGEEYQPEDGALEVVITDPAIAEELAPQLEVWHIHDDGRGEQITDFAVEGDSARFMADSFSVYVVVETVVSLTLGNGDSVNYLVTVEYDTDTGIPANAELAVTELLEGTEAYETYVRQAAELLGREPRHLAFAHAFDISLIDPQTGAHYQPNRDIL